MEKIRLIKFGGKDSPSHEFESQLRTLIEQCDDLYPGIALWFKMKVLPDFRSKDRLAYLIKLGSVPVGATIVRRGKDAKICSLRIVPDQQGQDLGELLFAVAAIELRGQAEHVHFTAPSQLWEEKEQFFRKLGFNFAGPAGTQYRLFDQEISCGAPFEDFWRSVVRILPSIGESLSTSSTASRCNLVLSMKPAYAREVMSGRKRVEIRRRFSNKWQGSIAMLYSSRPQAAFVGELKIGKVVKKSPEEIWDEYRESVGCDRESFLAYCTGSSSVFAIHLDEIRPFRDPILGSQLEHLIEKDIRPPQSYCEVKVNTVWPAAITLSHLLRSGVQA